MKSCILFLCIVFTLTPLSFTQEKIILDTDPSADPDDVGCMAMLHNMASEGECEILAIINSTHYKQSPLSISAINHFYNRQAIPVGDYKGYEEKIEAPKTNYDYHLARVYPKGIMSWKDAMDGVKLYREILASAADTSITVAIIGTMHNFYDLLRSGPDRYSQLNGVELVAQKVKQVVTMGGNFIEGKGYDRTNWGGADALCSYTSWSCLNEERNRMCRYVIENCPSPFIASGWEVGCGDYHDANYGNVMTGQGLRDLDTTHILRRSYEYHFLTRRETPDITRHSNDQCALHFAVLGERKNYVAYRNGDITLTEEGVCIWDEKTNNKQGYIQKKRDKDLIAQEIEMLMMKEKPGIDRTPPQAPQDLTYGTASGHVRVSWSPVPSTEKGSWVVAYHVYEDDEFLQTSYGTQFFMENDSHAERELEIRAVNASGIESESSWIRIQ